MVVVGGCAASVEEATPEPPSLEGRVTWAEPAAPERVEVATLLATVVPKPGGRSELTPLASGRIARWLVAPGRRVGVGTALATLHSPELGAMQDAVGAARKVAAAARAKQAAVAAQAGFGVVPASDVTVAAAETAAADAQVTALRAGLGRHDAVGRGGTWTWSSPVAGVVAEVLCPTGSAPSDQPCLAIVVPGAVEVVVDVPERHLGTLAAAAEADLVLADGTRARLEETGREPEIEPTTGSRRFRFAAPEGALAGASGRATLLRPPTEDDRRVPSRAVLVDEGGHVVLVQDDTLAHAVVVEVVGTVDGDAVVRGVPAGAKVAVDGVFLLQSLLSLDPEGGEE
jgi:multidrug efflux pump subunit AcrA (membrane-fusion protein)